MSKKRDYQLFYLLTMFCVQSTALLTPSQRSALAMPANPQPIDFAQPDGTRIRLHLRGDEYFHWFEDLKGYTVVRDEGKYVYARLNGRGELAPTQLLVGQADPRVAGLARKITPSPAVRVRLSAPILPMPAGAEAPSSVPPSGTVKNLVVLCKFSDHSLATHTRAPGDYTTLFNAPGGDPTLAPTGSVRDCYLENSYNIMTLNSTVAAWVSLPQTEAYYADGQSGLSFKIHEMVHDALMLVDPLVDFDQFDTDSDGVIDAITMIHSGYGAEFDGNPNRIWSHRWAIPTWTSAEGVNVSDYHTEPALWSTSGTDICRIGVIVHETGHFFGLPDFYDINGGGEGIGSYCMMANSWGFDGSQLHPPHLSAYCKIFLGWVSPTTISAPGDCTALQSETSPAVFRIDTNYPAGEYLLIENRQPTGFESDMPQGGLAIWHIDENKGGNTEEGYPGQPGWPGNNQHYRIALLQADGDYDLEHGINRGDGGDVYHGSGIQTLDASTTPNTHAYQNGTTIVTNNAITAVSAAGPSMTFHYGVVIPPACDRILFSENFESGPGGFIVNNSFGDGNGLWHLSTACENTSGGHTTPQALFYGVDASCDYDAGTTEGIVTSPGISLAGLTTPIRLSFKYNLQTEFFPSNYDMITVEVSQNGGAFVAVAGNNPGATPVTLSDPSGGWTTATVDLSSMVDSTIQIRFHFRTVDGAFNAYPGFYVDDVQVCSACGTSGGTGCPPIYGDSDHDGDVDATDFDAFDNCVSRPAVTASIPCMIYDLNSDNDVDMDEFGTFQRCISGEDIPADPTCDD